MEWLGEVPEHWHLRRLGYYFAERREKVSDQDFPALSVTKHGIVPQLETAAKTDDGGNRKLVRRGDFVINSRSDRKGSAGVSDRDGSVSLISSVLVPQEQVFGPFVHHLLRSVPFKEEYYRNGKGIVADLWSTNFSDMKEIVLAVPPIEEQASLASFLGRETAKIDELVAEQQRLIDLLKEKRRAVISHAVTKGLNPDAPMKSSGVEWLAEVPARWEIKRLKYIAERIVDCPHETPEYSSEGSYGVIRTADLSHGVLRGSLMLRVDESEYAKRIRRAPLRTGDVVYAREGERWGHAALVDRDDHYCLGQRMIQIIPAESKTADFLMWSMNSDSTYRQGEVDTVGATSPHINVERIRNFYLAWPPLEERAVIGERLLEATHDFDRLIAEAETAKHVLLERRSALISAAVTGQIDLHSLSQDNAA
ncbi:MAG: restriction endonuclease subunit S [Gemmatimonadetes bacterium]|nr:restriction endonuclease subunit S [Gemmatimonadota bacterium]